MLALLLAGLLVGGGPPKGLAALIVAGAPQEVVLTSVGLAAAKGSRIAGGDR